jgi:CheY-like chemotaxis protein
VHTNANSALEYFKNIKKMENISPVLIPDYIFLDINMPLMDGWGFLQGFEKLNLPFDYKVIVLTASVNPADKGKAETYKNVVGFFSKPLSSAVLELL